MLTSAGSAFPDATRDRASCRNRRRSAVRFIGSRLLGMPYRLERLAAPGRVEGRRGRRRRKLLPPCGSTAPATRGQPSPGTYRYGSHPAFSGRCARAAKQLRLGFAGQPWSTGQVFGWRGHVAALARTATLIPAGVSPTDCSRDQVEITLHSEVIRGRRIAGGTMGRSISAHRATVPWLAPARWCSG